MSDFCKNEGCPVKKGVTTFFVHNCLYAEKCILSLKEQVKNSKEKNEKVLTKPSNKI